VSFENGTIPMSGLGLFEELHTHVVEKRILEGDIVILLSDGVYSKIKKSEILHIVDNNDIPFDKKAKSLLEFANSRGNLDNQAALFLQF
jgi:serine/threonine protein phosphatase PrpC